MSIIELISFELLMLSVTTYIIILIVLLFLWRRRSESQTQKRIKSNILDLQTFRKEQVSRLAAAPAGAPALLNQERETYKKLVEHLEGELKRQRRYARYNLVYPSLTSVGVLGFRETKISEVLDVLLCLFS